MSSKKKWSKIRQFFTPKKKDESSICNTCRKEIVHNTRTSHLWNHMRAKHIHLLIDEEIEPLRSKYVNQTKDDSATLENPKKKRKRTDGLPQTKNPFQNVKSYQELQTFNIGMNQSVCNSKVRGVMEEMDSTNIHRRLSLNEKLGILQRIDSGENYRSIANFYNVTYKVVYLVNRNREKIIEFCQMQDPVGTQVLLRKNVTIIATSSPLDVALYEWFEATKGKETVSARSLRNAALRINRDLGGPSNFECSDSWMKRFKRRYAIGVKQTKLQGIEASTVDINIAKDFCNEFKHIVTIHGYKPENIYNVVESSMQWNLLPQEIEQFSYLRALKNRVPFILCANSNGSHKLQVTVSGRYPDPPSFQDYEIPVKYASHGSSYRSDCFLSKWFQQVFTPEIKQRRAASQSKEYFLLVMDITPAPLTSRQAEELGVQIVTIPREAMLLLQPFCQGILERFKKAYKEDFIEEMVVRRKGVRPEKWNIRDSCFSMAYTWDTFTAEDIQVGWRKLLKIDELDEENHQEPFSSCEFIEEKDEDNSNELDQNIDKFVFVDVGNFCETTPSDIEDENFPGFENEGSRESSENTRESLLPITYVPSTDILAQYGIEPKKSLENDDESRNSGQTSQSDMEQTNIEEEIKRLPLVPSTRDKKNISDDINS